MQMVSITIHVALRASDKLVALRHSRRPDLYDVLPFESSARPLTLARVQTYIATIFQTTDYL